MTDTVEMGGFVPNPPDDVDTVVFLSDSSLEPPRILEDLIEEFDVNPFKESLRVRGFFETEEKKCIEEQESWYLEVVAQCDSLEDLILTS